MLPFRSHLLTNVLPFALSCVTTVLLAQQAPTASLQIQTDKPVAKVSPTLYGLMTEEINYSYDGGLYGELVNSRAIGSHWGALEHWVAVTQGDAQASIEVDQKDGPSAALPRSLKLTVKEAGKAEEAGVQNDGYWGIPVRPDTTYQASFYAKADTPSIGQVKISIVKDSTGETLASATIPAIGTEWKQYNATLKTGHVPVSATNHLVLSVENPGTLWLDLVSLFPPTYKGREHGFRIDLMEKLAAMHPAFLRLPGGNYLEGDHIAERFEWKKTIGPWSIAPPIPAPGVTTPPTAWACSSFWSGARTCTCSRCSPSMPATRWRRSMSNPARLSSPTCRMRSTRSNTSPAARTRNGAPSAPRTAIPRPSR